MTEDIKIDNFEWEDFGWDLDNPTEVHICNRMAEVWNVIIQSGDDGISCPDLLEALALRGFPGPHVAEICQALILDFCITIKNERYMNLHLCEECERQERALLN